jgi:hypothetical protein
LLLANLYMQRTILVSLREEWTVAWQSAKFRRKVVTGFFAVALILTAFPVFFQAIEKREGILLNDRILELLPAHNVSIPIFIIVWLLTALTLFRCLQNPDMLVTLLWSYILLSLSRFLSITLVPLDPPADLIGLADPLANTFYGPRFVTKDLFFSGHTSTLFLMFLCLQTRTDKLLALAGTTVVGVLLLVQHVHYTMDVLAAPVFTWLIYRLTLKVIL